MDETTVRDGSVYPVQFDNEQAPTPRYLILPAPAMKVGQSVVVGRGDEARAGVITGIASSVIHVRRAGVPE